MKFLVGLLVLSISSEIVASSACIAEIDKIKNEVSVTKEKCENLSVEFKAIIDKNNSDKENEIKEFVCNGGIRNSLLEQQGAIAIICTPEKLKVKKEEGIDPKKAGLINMIQSLFVLPFF